MSTNGTAKSVRPATPADLWRLASQARERGLRLFFEPYAREWFCSSASDPMMVYRLTSLSCSCPGFQQWQRCTHHALLLEHLGWLPDLDPDPAPAASSSLPVACPLCHGDASTCPVCEGDGVVQELRAAPRPVPVATRRCPECRGEGARRMITGGGLDNWVAIPCDRCGTSGRIPVEDGQERQAA